MAKEIVGMNPVDPELLEAREDVDTTWEAFVECRNPLMKEILKDEIIRLKVIRCKVGISIKAKVALRNLHGLLSPVSSFSRS